MLTLIRKDLLLHKTAFYGFTPVLVIYLIWMASHGESRNAYITFACIFATILPLIFIAREDKFGAEAFVCSLPVTRGQVARAKYLISWGVALIFALIGLVIYSLLAAEGALAIWSVSTAGRVLLSLTLGLGVMLPFLLWFGWTGLIVGLVGTQVLGVVTLLIVKTFTTDLRLSDAFTAVSDFIEGMHSQLGGLLFFAAVIVIFAIFNLVSCKIAVALFERREF